MVEKFYCRRLSDKIAISYEITFFGTFGDKTVGSPQVPRESLIDIVFIGIIDSVGWLNVYVAMLGRPTVTPSETYSFASFRIAVNENICSRADLCPIKIFLVLE